MSLKPENPHAIVMGLRTLQCSSQDHPETAMIFVGSQLTLVFGAGVSEMGDYENREPQFGSAKSRLGEQG